MIRLFINEILLEHVDLFVSKHSFFCYLTQSFDLLGKSLILVNFFHESCILLRLGGVDRFRPASFTMVHSFFASANTGGIDLMHGKVCNVVEFDEVGVA